MNLVKWDPFRELEDVSKRLNRIFGQPPARAEAGNEMLAVADWAPSVDISETESAYLIKGEIPGVKKEDVKISIQDGMLTIQGERKQEREDKDKKYHRIERSYGSFHRSFSLPQTVDRDKIKAGYKNGVLTVTLAKREEVKPKQIRIDVGQA